MPIARIVTSMPELTGGLVRDLNSRGFEVHILSPLQAPSGDVDLEIKLEIAASDSIARTIPVSPVTVQSDDIWTMLTAFDGDVQGQDSGPSKQTYEKMPEEIPAVDAQVNFDAPVNKDSTSNSPVVVDEPIFATFAEIISEPLDPELVPSIFGLSSFPSRFPAGTQEQGAAGLSEERPSAHSALRNVEKSSWDSRPKLAAAAAASAMVIILLVISLTHRRAPLPENMTSPSHDVTTQLPFHPATAAATSSVVPVKEVITSDPAVPLKTVQRPANRESSIAQDTIVHFGSARKIQRPSREKQAGVRYYSDLD